MRLIILCISHLLIIDSSSVFPEATSLPAAVGQTDRHVKTVNMLQAKAANVFLQMYAVCLKYYIKLLATHLFVTVGLCK